MRDTFGPYKRLFEIGRGGMATVYRATAPDGNLVALKLLGIHLASDRTAVNRFRNESELGLNHPNIVRVNHAGIIEDTPFIEMEYVPGESLDRLILRQGPLTPAQLAPILEDAAHALDFAHQNNVVHRDVKPSNILIRSDGRAMLADFGVAKAANITAYTATTARVGSVFYMSPEQAAGAYNITSATDVYSLGVTAYYALSGRHPFEGDNDVAIARQHVDRLPPHLSDINHAVPRPVGDVVMSALEKNPERRPASAGAFARAFVASLTAPQLLVTPKAKPEPVKRAPLPVEPPIGSVTVNAVTEEGGGPVPRSTWLIVGSVVGILAVVALGLFLFALINPQQRPSITPTPSNPSIGGIATATPDSVLTPIGTPAATIIVLTAQPSPTVVFVFPTALVPPSATPWVINPVIPTATPIVFPTLPPVLPTSTPAPPTLTPIPPTATPVPPTPTDTPVPPPTNTPLPPTDTPVPPPTNTPLPPTDTPVPPTVGPTPTPAITVIVAP